MLTSFASDWLTIPSLGQFNLITGRNGVGKTQLLRNISYSSYSVLGNMDYKPSLGSPAVIIHTTAEPLTPTSMSEGWAAWAIECQVETLLIDQVDFNLHYTSIKPMWEKLLGDAHKNGIQVFATTHSMECVRYFSEVASEHGYDVRLINIRDTVGRCKEALLYNTDELYEMVKDGLELT